MRTRAIPERFCSGDSLRRGAISSVWTFTFTFNSTRVSATCYNATISCSTFVISHTTAQYAGPFDDADRRRCVVVSGRRPPDVLQRPLHGRLSTTSAAERADRRQVPVPRPAANRHCSVSTVRRSTISTTARRQPTSTSNCSTAKCDVFSTYTLRSRRGLDVPDVTTVGGCPSST